ncbi:ATPase [Spirochaetia bacterium]|nr:ATPase [Spirochaetia bacterium]
MLIERKPYMQTLRDFKDEHIIKVISGVRRCGKSTLLEMFADELRQTVSEEQIQFYNFEDLDVLSIGDYKQVYDHIKVKIIPGKMNYIFLDEVQNIKTFERLVDSLYIKKNVDLYVTGSNAYLLSGELATLLTGRYIEISILPFSFAEYCEFYRNSPNLTKIADSGNLSSDLANSPNLQNLKVWRISETKPPNSQNLQNLQVLGISRTRPVNSQNLSKIERLVNFSQSGGLPQTAGLDYSTSDQSVPFLSGVLNTIIEKDVFTQREVYNKPTFQKIVDFVFDSAGSFVSPASISGTLKNEGIIIDHKTIAQYLDYLVSAFLIYKVPRYDIKGKNLLRSLDKYYMVDTGFRRIRLPQRPDADVGHILENIVYLELRRRFPKVFVGKLRNGEVDFVVMDHKGYIAYYQVAYTSMERSTLERELAPLKAIRDSNPKFLLTTDIDINPVYDGIRKLNVADWLLNNEKSRW